MRLPKISAPEFDSNILNWKQFWEKFTVSVNDRSNLSNAEKLVHLQHVIKDGSAKPIIKGLSQSAEHYEEAVKFLNARYNCPRLIYQTHVKMILNAPPVCDVSGKVLRCLHDII